MTFNPQSDFRNSDISISTSYAKRDKARNLCFVTQRYKDIGLEFGLTNLQFQKIIYMEL